jgi:axial budding pattern protein 2
LPSWISFDAAALKFVGNTPAFPGAEPETFTFQLIASDVAGFSAANMTFQLSIGPHILAFNETAQTFNLTRGDKFTSPSFQSLLSVDGSPMTSNDLAKVDATLPDWLSMDNDSISLSGTPPKDAVNQNITITVTDTYSDQAALMVRLDFLKLFLDTVEGCEATIGEDFTFVFNQSTVTDSSVQLDVDLPEELSSWLTYFPSNKTLYGHIPSDAKPQKFSMALTAHQGDTEDTQDFDIDVLEPADTHSSSGDPFSSQSTSSHKKAGVIAISVVIPVVVIMSLVILFCCWRRRSKLPKVEEEGQFSTKSPPPRPARPDMPNCEPGATGRISQDDNSDDWMSPLTPAADLPKLELGPAWNVASFDKPEESMTAIPSPNPPARSPKRAFVPLRDSIREEDKPLSQSPTKQPPTKQSPTKQSPTKQSPTRKQNQRLSFTSSPPVRRRRSTNRSRREPLKAIQPRAMKRESMQSSRSKRYSKRSSGISTMASGLPVRFSGAGHGAGGFGPPGHGVVHMSWQSTKASLMSDDSSMMNMTPLFPRPPAAARGRHSMASSIPENYKRVTLRAVEPDESTISEADSLEAFVHSRAKSRNSANPLFSAQVSRRTASGLRALERARSIRSRADTVSVSTFTDEFRQSIQERPHSTALSVSEYGDENRMSQYHTLQPPQTLFPLAEGGGKSQSQLSLAQDYRGVISPLPRFWSETSLSSNRRLESGNHSKAAAQTEEKSSMPLSSSIASDLEEHLSRKASPQKNSNNPFLNAPLMDRPPPIRDLNNRGLPVASSGELAFV